MPGRLGCGTHSAWVVDKCSGPRVCSLTDADLITYDRRLDDISEAEVQIPIGGSLDTPCCRCLGDLEPWCHELVIARDGEVVWQGPIIEVVYTLNRVTVRARDKLAWLTVRINEGDLAYLNNTTVSLTDIAQDIVETAMADDGDSPCVLDCIINLGDGLPAGTDRSRCFPAYRGPTAFDDFQRIAETGVDYTVVRNCLILGSEDLQVNPIATLMDHHILGEGLEIRKDGNLYGNRFFTRFDGDETGPASCDGSLSPQPAFAENTDTQCYGLIERFTEDLSGIPSFDAAQTVAQSYADASSVAPRTIEFPAGAQLAPETPWEINEMIPGQRVNVAMSLYCLPVFQSFRLLGMRVEDNPAGEVITVQLGTLNSITGRT